DRGDSEGKQALEPLSSYRFQLFLAGAANLLDRSVDAASPDSDLFIAFALQALLELALARSCEYQMRVTINEAGEDDLASGVEDFRIRRHGRQIRSSADPLNDAIRNDDGAVGDDIQASHFGPASRNARPDTNELRRPAQDEKLVHG